MCELLGMSANTPTDICFSFSGLIERGGRTGPHKDGWGITFYHGKGIRTFKDHNPSCQSDIARLVKDFPIRSDIVISHIRQANRGRVCLENTHPFIRELNGQYWTFAHNGQLKSVKSLPLKHFRPVGTTDSEHAFCWLLDQLHRLNTKPGLTNSTIHTSLISGAKKLSELGVFNMLITNGKRLYSFGTKPLYAITRQSPFGEASLIDTEMSVNFSQVTTPRDRVTIIASSPLTDNEAWVKLPSMTLVTVDKGHILNTHNRPTSPYQRD
jgi:predicted glutamine amidotransferase